MGSDGSVDGKNFIKGNLKEIFHKDDFYGEVSHAVERLTQGSPVVCAVIVPDVLQKVVYATNDAIHYARNLAGIGKVVKKLIGNPGSFPSGSPNACPLPGEPGIELKPGEMVKTARSKWAHEVELSEHFSNMLDLD